MNELLERLRDDPVPRKRRRVAVAATSLAVLVVSAVAGYRRLTACDGLEREVEPAWSVSIARQGQLAFERVGLTESGWSRVQGLLDAYATKWLSARVNVCRAEHAGELSAHALDLRLECLAERRDELKALSLAFTSADRATVVHAFAAASQLPSIEECANRSRVESPSRAVAHDRREDVKLLKQKLIGARTALLVGDSPRAAKEAKPVFTDAVNGAPPVLVAQSALVLGQALVNQDDRGCLAVFERGLLAASSAGEEELALRLLAEILTERGRRRSHPEEARALIPVAKGLAIRLEGARSVVGLFHEAVGEMEWEAGEFEAALRSYRDAVAALQAEPSDRSLDLARVKASISWVLAAVGNLDEAQAEIAEAKRMTEALVGPNHVAMRLVWSAQANLASMRNDNAVAIEAGEHIVELMITESGPDSPRLVTPLLNLVIPFTMSGKEAKARATLAEAERLIELDPAGPLQSRIAALQRRALIELSVGHGPEAEAVSRRALELSMSATADSANLTQLSEGLLLLGLLECGHFSEALERSTKLLAAVDPSQRSGLECVRARALVGLSRFTEAIALLEPALSEWPDDYDLAEHGRTLLALADAQWALGKRADARATAERARVLLSRSEIERLRRMAGAWLADHP